MKILRIPLVIVLVFLAGRAFRANAQTVTILYSFAGSPFDTDGIDPAAGLVQGADGNFYGTTVGGGTATNCGGVGTGCGTVFRISPSGTETTLYSFGSVPNDGNVPQAGLVQGSDGNLYGTTSAGGTNDAGTVFRISASGTETTLYSFVGYPYDGYEPLAGLVQGSDGNLYGTTSAGGTSDQGTVFRISPSGSYAILYSFVGYPYDGAQPYAGLVQDGDGNFYGTTAFGGTNDGYGTVFRISPSGTETTLYSFGSSPNDGNAPQAGLVQGSDGNFYGTTSAGGTNDAGTVFRISPSGTETTLYSFGSSPNDGNAPQAGLVQGSDGNLYGTTSAGGTSDQGTVFRISPSGTQTTLYSFASGDPDGEDPQAALVQGSDGNFYGTTEYGGTNNSGTVFELALGGGGGADCAYLIGSTNAIFDAAGGSDSVNVTASNGCAWKAISINSFITITSGFNGFGNGTVNYAVAANSNDSVQTGTIIIAGQTFTVTEAAATCSVSPTLTSANFGSAGGSNSVTVTANGPSCIWSATSNNAFITITSGSGGTGNGTVNYTVAANTSTTGRSGTVQIAGQTFTITQAGVNAETALITVQANPSSGGTVSGGGTFSVGSSQQLSASANTGWTFTSWSDGGAQTHNITVPSGGATYAANFTATSPTCTYTLSAASVTLAAKGGSEAVSVKVKGTDCAWTASTTNSWITITSGTSGTGNGTVKFTVPGNTNTTGCSGTIIIEGQTFTVNQAKGGCTYSLSPKGGKFKDTGGSGTVEVTPNFSDCNWVAVSNDGFITITAGASGAGKGTVSYTVEANTNTTALTASITIGEENFTVDEAAAPCELSLGGTAASFSSAGGSSNVTVRANGTNCTWKAVVSGTFIRITSDTGGTGNGTVAYTVEANTKTATRKGAITVGKEKLTIIQSGAP
jgi:uncharacterized repeat protein (TIGR03803 family)